MWNKRQYHPRPSGIIFVIAAPSGGGKTSLSNALVRSVDGLCRSISHTTRSQRNSERDGDHYYFVDAKTFNTMQQNDEFVETAWVFNAQYGTSKMAINAVLDQEKDVLLVIDWQGAHAVKTLFPEQTITIFLLPPSRATLLERLKKRGRDDSATIKTRIDEAEMEVSHCQEFDYLVINDNFDDALKQLASAVVAARCRSHRQIAHYQQLVQQLLPPQ